MTREEAFRQFVDAYDIEVPEERVENEYEYILLDMKHRMQYDRLTAGALHPFPQVELAQQEKELRELAYFEAKSELVLKELLRNGGYTADREELEQEAQRLAEEEGSTIEMVKRFFGEDLAGLERSVKERKAKEQIYQEMSAGQK